MDLKGKLTAAPHSIILDGETYQFSPLTDVDMDEMDLWLRSQFIRMARQSMMGLSDEERKETLQVAMETAAQITLFNSKGASVIATPAGMTHLLWMSLRKHHPDLKESSLHKMLLTDPSNIEAVMELFNTVNSVPNVKRNPSKNQRRARSLRRKK